MNGNLNSNNTEKEEITMNTEDSDYKELSAKLEEIKSTIALLEKTIFK